MNAALEKESEFDKAAIEMGYGCYNFCVGNEDSGILKEEIDYIKNLFSIMFGYRNIGESDNEEAIKVRIDGKMNELGYKCYNLGIEGKLPSKSLLGAFAKMRELSETTFTFQNEESRSENASADNETVQPEFAKSSEPVENMGGFLDDVSDFTDEADIFNNDFQWEPIPTDGIKCVCGYVNDKAWNFCKNCGKKLK